MTEWKGSQLFANLGQASDFFRQGATGYSARSSGDCLDGLELQTSAWQVEPVEIRSAYSTFFEDRARFPAGSATLDCALLMRNVPVAWNPLPPMPIDVAATARA